MVDYEWIVEYWTEDGEDILEVVHCPSFIDAKREASRDPHTHIVLVRDDYRTDKGWAYMTKRGRLPKYFVSSGGSPLSKVPLKFHKEVEHGSK